MARFFHIQKLFRNISLIRYLIKSNQFTLKMPKSSILSHFESTTSFFGVQEKPSQNF